MSRHQWFGLAVRVVGLWFLVLAFPRFVEGIGYIVSAIENSFPDPWRHAITQLVGATVQLAAGAYCLFGAPRLVRWCLRDIDTTCARCGYSLAGITGDVCPECSLRFRESTPSAAGSTASPVAPGSPTNRAD